MKKYFLFNNNFTGFNILLVSPSGKVETPRLQAKRRCNLSLCDVIGQGLKGISSRILLQDFPHLKKQFWGRHFWARGYLAVSSGTITDEMIKEYIDEQEGESITDDSRFPIDKPSNPST